MSDVDLTTSVGQYVVERPTRARVFERLGIDYCCGGNALRFDLPRRHSTGRTASAG